MSFTPTQLGNAGLAPQDHSAGRAIPSAGAPDAGEAGGFSPGDKARLPTALDSEHQKMRDDLKAKNGKYLDQGYDQIQVKAHWDAVALFEAYAKTGDNAELKDWAGKTLPHLKNTSAWRKSSNSSVIRRPGVDRRVPC